MGVSDHQDAKQTVWHTPPGDPVFPPILLATLVNSLRAWPELCKVELPLATLAH